MNIGLGTDIQFPLNVPTAICKSDIFNLAKNIDDVDNNQISIAKVTKIDNYLVSEPYYIADKPLKPSYMLVYDGYVEGFEVIAIAGQEYVKFNSITDVERATLKVYDFDASFVKSLRAKTVNRKSYTIDINLSEYPTQNQNPESVFGIADNVFQRPSYIQDGSVYQFTFEYTNDLTIYGAISKDIVIEQVPGGRLLKSVGSAPYNLIKLNASSQVNFLPTPSLRYFPYYVLDENPVADEIYIYKMMANQHISRTPSILDNITWTTPTRMSDIINDPFIDVRTHATPNMRDLTNLIVDWDNYGDSNYIAFKSHLGWFKDTLNYMKEFYKPVQLCRDASKVLKAINVLFEGASINRTYYEWNKRIIIYYQDIKNNNVFIMDERDIMELKGFYRHESSQFIQDDANGTDTIKIIWPRPEILTTWSTRNIMVLLDHGDISPGLFVDAPGVYVGMCQLPNGDMSITAPTPIYPLGKDGIHVQANMNPNAVAPILFHEVCRWKKFSRNWTFNPNQEDDLLIMLMGAIPGMLNGWFNGRLAEGPDIMNVFRPELFGNVMINLVDYHHDVLLMMNTQYNMIDVDLTQMDGNLLARGIFELPDFSHERDILLINGRIITSDDIVYIMGKVWFTVAEFNKRIASIYNGNAIGSIKILQYSNPQYRALHDAMFEVDRHYYYSIPMDTRMNIINAYPVTTPTKPYAPHVVPQTEMSLVGYVDYMLHIMLEGDVVNRVAEDGDNPVWRDNFKSNFLEMFSKINVNTIYQMNSSRGNKILINGNSIDGKYKNPEL